jgi:hypothetical protein
MSIKSSSRPADDELDRLVAFGITRQQVEPGDDCLDPELLASYADGGLSAEERAAAEAHLARCRDCRRALTLQVESDPLVASAATSTLALDSAADGAAGSNRTPTTDATPGALGTPGAPGAPVGVGAGSRGTAARPAIVKFANTWLPLAAALFVATGLWFAFNRSRQESPQGASAPAHFSARNEPSGAQQPEAPPPATAAAPRQSAPDSSSTDRAASGGQAPRELLQESSPAGGAASSGAAPSAKESSSRADAAAAQAPAPALGRARGTFREEVAATARPNANTEADRRIVPASPAAPGAAPAPPPPPPAALADAAPARLGGAAGAAGQEAQARARAAGQLAPNVAPPAAPAAAAPAPTQTAAANPNATSQQQPTPQQAGQQATSQQYVINQQTGPSANLNVAPPPAKADERRQADASKQRDTDTKREANEKSAGGPSSVKSADAFAKAIEEPKSVARAKAAPESPPATAPVDAVSTTTSANAANAASGRKTEAESAASGSGATAARPAAGASPGASPGAAAGADRNAAVRGAGAGAGAGGAAAGARAAEISPERERGIAESVTAITAAPAPTPVLRSVDGARWWRIRAPSTIEGSTDRGASWTVEYSDPSARLVRGAAAAKGGCWMIGANGLVLRTRPNGGWERVTQPTTRNLATLTATDHLIATVTDDQGRAYRTTDGGATWR